MTNEFKSKKDVLDAYPTGPIPPSLVLRFGITNEDIAKAKTNRERQNTGRELGELRHEIGNLEYRYRNGDHSLWPQLVKLWSREDELSADYGILRKAALG